MTYALCGFSSFAALGILFDDLLASLMATRLTGCVTGILT